VEPLVVNGDPPELAGLRCDAILCSEYWHGGRLVESSNVAYLCFEGRWHRLYFDYGIIFWRPAREGPPFFDAAEIDASFPVVDVASAKGLVGVHLSGYEMAPIERGARVTFAFENGRRLSFTSIDDTTSYQDG
jgi:hypothetical protein